MSTAPELIKISEMILRDPSVILYLSTLTFGMAFTWGARKKILERDNHQSVKSGKQENLEAAHIDHSKKNPRYNDPSNGRMLTRAEHYMDHYDRAGRNGLAQNHNKWALRSIWKRLTQRERAELATSNYPDPYGRYDYIDQYPFTIDTETDM